MLWVGLTGSMGSGKSTVASILSEFGYPVISADEMSHNLTKVGAQGLQVIAKEFGPSVLKSNGELNRPALAKIVFSNSANLQKLEGLLHPLIQKQVVDWKQQKVDLGEPICFYDVPLLFEKNLEDQFDSIVCVDAPVDQIIRRVKKRSGLTEKQIRERLSHQVDPSEKRLKSNFVIVNDGSIEELKKRVRIVADELLKTQQS